MKASSIVIKQHMRVSVIRKYLFDLFFYLVAQISEIQCWSVLTLMRRILVNGQSIPLFVSLSLCHSVPLSLCLSVSLYLYLSVCLSLSRPVKNLSKSMHKILSYNRSLFPKLSIQLITIANECPMANFQEILFKSVHSDS